jgi:adenylate kinase family enzyme
MRRISVVGPSGSGKTTVARRVAAKLGVPHVELDALYWEPNWTQADDVTFRARVAAATSADGWVADGNYTRAQDIVLARADTLVWLDLPLGTVLGRILRRTARRLRSGEELWSGNRETWQVHLKRDSLISWTITSHRAKRRDYTERFLGPNPEYPHLNVFRFRSSAEAERWLESL